jgi:hypothetical protein
MPNKNRGKLELEFKYLAPVNVPRGHKPEYYGSMRIRLANDTSAPGAGGALPISSFAFLVVVVITPFFGLTVLLAAWYTLKFYIRRARTTEKKVRVVERLWFLFLSQHISTARSNQVFE